MVIYLIWLILNNRKMYYNTCTLVEDIYEAQSIEQGHMFCSVKAKMWGVTLAVSNYNSQFTTTSSEGLHQSWRLNSSFEGLNTMVESCGNLCKLPLPAGPGTILLTYQMAK